MGADRVLREWPDCHYSGMVEQAMGARPKHWSLLKPVTPENYPAPPWDSVLASLSIQA